MNPLTQKIIFVGLLASLVACTSARVPRADEIPTPRTTPTRTIPTPSATTTSPEIVPALTPTPTGPEGGAIAISVLGNSTLELNDMPEIVQDAVFDSLLQIDPKDGSLKPGLAESFQVSNDAMTLTFRLRAGVKWHNGDALTADDIVATLKAFASPSFRGKPVTDFGAFTSATAIDAQTVQLNFSEAYCAALTSIGTLNILPRAIASSSNFPKLTPAQMIGTGALKFVSITNDQFTLERNANYYRGAPHIDTLTIQAFSDTATMRTAFSNKKIDVMTAAPGEYPTIKKIADANILAFDAPQIITVLYNIDTTALNDPRVRQALNYAIDRNVLLGDIGNQATLVDASMQPGSWASVSNLPSYNFDLAKAKQLLNDAGWRAGTDGILRKNTAPLRIELLTEADDSLLEPLAFRLREMYATLGIQAQMALNDRPGWVTRAFQHRFDVLLLTRTIPIDPDQRWYWQSEQNDKTSGFNFGSYANKRIDALFQDGLRTPACENKARTAIYANIQRALVADVPAAFLFAPKKYLVARERVLGLAPSTFAGEFWNLNELRVK